jgi:hypothetical protein
LAAGGPYFQGWPDLPPAVADEATEWLGYQEPGRGAPSFSRSNPFTEAVPLVREERSLKPLAFKKVKLCQRQKDKKPLTCENTVPEVGLELHSDPCKHWETAETCGIRSSPTDVRPVSTAKVWTLSTLSFAPEMGPTGVAGPGMPSGLTGWCHNVLQH